MYYTVIKHSGHLRTLYKCRKHSPAAHVCYISLVFSNDHRVLSQCNTRLRLLYLLIRSLTTFLCVYFNITNYELLHILQTRLENLKGKPVSIVLLGLTLTKFLSFLVVHRVRETIISIKLKLMVLPITYRVTLVKNSHTIS